ncbi:MAG TPA: amidohydrolase family protein [Jiangellaceae bacterium]|nr:amidohydrolase family protein [Jiangellaceae bacterium]
MSVWHLRGVVLPEAEERDIYVVGDRLSLEHVGGAETVHEGGFLLPGLVDTHCHPGTAAIGEPLDEQQLRHHGEELRAQGVSLVRVPGGAGRLPGWFRADRGMPRVKSAGLAVALTGRFFPGWGRQVSVADVADVAAQEAAADGWCKLIVDWMTDDGDYTTSIPASVVAEATTRVHECGGRVAVHSQHAEGGRASVDAGVDSVEHGMHLPTDVLDQMAAQDTALVPTAVTFAELAGPMAQPEVPDRLRQWFATGWDRHAALVRSAFEAGVTVLAGTDLPPGHLTAEVRWLADAGLPSEVALGAASWTARNWLGVPGIDHDAPADVLAFDEDPRADLAVLDHPARTVVRGQLL